MTTLFSKPRGIKIWPKRPTWKWLYCTLPVCMVLISMLFSAYDWFLMRKRGAILSHRRMRWGVCHHIGARCKRGMFSRVPRWGLHTSLVTTKIISRFKDCIIGTLFTGMDLTSDTNPPPNFLMFLSVICGSFSALNSLPVSKKNKYCNFESNPEFRNKL